MMKFVGFAAAMVAAISAPASAQYYHPRVQIYIPLAPRPQIACITQQQAMTPQLADVARNFYLIDQQRRGCVTWQQIQAFRAHQVAMLQNGQRPMAPPVPPGYGPAPRQAPQQYRPPAPVVPAVPATVSMSQRGVAFLRKGMTTLVSETSDDMQSDFTFSCPVESLYLGAVTVAPVSSNTGHLSVEIANGMKSEGDGTLPLVVISPIDIGAHTERVTIRSTDHKKFRAHVYCDGASLPAALGVAVLNVAVQGIFEGSDDTSKDSPVRDNLERGINMAISAWQRGDNTVAIGADALINEFNMQMNKKYPGQKANITFAVTTFQSLVQGAYEHATWEMSHKL